jgi:hypothetical protein
MQDKALTMLESNRGTSTTKKQKEEYAGCGAKEETVKKMMKCSRCEIVRYCSVVRQKKHSPVHKKVCASVNKQVRLCGELCSPVALGWRHEADFRT